MVPTQYSSTCFEQPAHRGFQQHCLGVCWRRRLCHSRYSLTRDLAGRMPVLVLPVCCHGLSGFCHGACKVSVALLSYAFGRNLTWTSWTGIWLAFCGALVIAAGEVKSIRATAAPQQTLIGILFALASVGTRSLKIVVMDFLLAPREYVSELSPLKETPLSPMQLYSLQAPWCVLAAFVFAVCTDSFQRAVAELNRDAAFLITLTCATWQQRAAVFVSELQLWSHRAVTSKLA